MPKFGLELYFALATLNGLPETKKLERTNSVLSLETISWVETFVR